MNFDFEKLILPLASSLVGLIPVLINLTVNRMERRSKTARLNTFLQQSTQRISYLKTWYDLQKEVGPPDQMPKIKELVHDELNDSFEEMMDAFLDPEYEMNRRQELLIQYRNTSSLRRFLLLFPPYNLRGWFYHTLFYMSALPLIVALGYMLFSYDQTTTWMENLPQEYILIGIAFFALTGIFRSLGRQAAKDVEKRLAAVTQKTAPLQKSPGK